MSDLTADEQTNVRAAMRFLRTRIGAWEPLGKALRIDRKTAARVCGGSLAVSASLAVRVARLATVGVDDVLTGKYPVAGTCPHCGHRKEDVVDAAE